MIIRPAIVVPTLDNSVTIVSVVNQLIGATDCAILVVDDGSAIPVEKLLKESGATLTRVTVLRTSVNRGKGVALRTAVEWAIRHEYSHIITVDADGQHPTEAVCDVLREAATRPWNLVIGARRWPAADVPRSSRFGRQFSGFWVWYQTGRWISDSQSGLRAYPLFYVQNLPLRTSRYEFEIEVLVRLIWAGVGVTEIPVDVVYPPARERLSHFRPLIDNVRLSLLNIVLVVLTLFGHRWTVLGISGGLLAGSGTGILLSSGMLDPFATVATVAAAAALVVCLRLNASMAILALAGSFLAARGAEMFAISSALVFASFIVVACWRKFSRVGSRQWTWRVRGGRVGNKIIELVTRYIGLRATYVCLLAIVPYFYLFAPKARRSSHQYFRAVWPQQGYLARCGSVLRHFFVFGAVLLDRLFQSFYDRRVFAADIVGDEEFRAIAGGKNGTVLLSAHVGGWDLSTRMLGDTGFAERVVVAEFVMGGGISSAETVRAGDRRSLGGVTKALEHLNAAGSASAMLAYKEHLENGKILAIMADRPLSEKHVMVQFMGKLAAFDITPFRIALALGVPVVYSFAARVGWKKYELNMIPSPSVKPGLRREEAAIQMTHDFAAALETFLRRQPYQWFNFYEFFSTRPQTVGS